MIKKIIERIGRIFKRKKKYPRECMAYYEPDFFKPFNMPVLYHDGWLSMKKDTLMFFESEGINPFGAGNERLRKDDVIYIILDSGDYGAWRVTGVDRGWGRGHVTFVYVKRIKRVSVPIWYFHPRHINFRCALHSIN